MTLNSYSLKEKNDFQEWVYDEINQYPSVQKFLKGNSDPRVFLLKEIVAGCPISDVKELLYFCDLAYRRIEANETWEDTLKSMDEEGGFDYSSGMSPFPITIAPHFQHLLTGHIGGLWMCGVESITFPSFYPKSPIGKRFLDSFEGVLPTLQESLEYMKNNDTPTPTKRLTQQISKSKKKKVKSKRLSLGFGN